MLPHARTRRKAHRRARVAASGCGARSATAAEWLPSERRGGRRRAAHRGTDSQGDHNAHPGDQDAGSPTHRLSTDRGPSPAVSTSKPSWIREFHVACISTDGQMLPVASRDQQATEPMPSTVTPNNSAPTAGTGPAA